MDSTSKAMLQLVVAVVIIATIIGYFWMKVFHVIPPGELH